jgi:hypothetical protein
MAADTKPSLAPHARGLSVRAPLNIGLVGRSLVVRVVPALGA